MFNPLMSSFHKLKQRVVFAVSSFFQTDEQQELLKTVNSHLVIWNHELLNIQNGRRASLADMQAQTIASAAKSILSSELKNKQSLQVALFLANSEVIATEYELAGVAAHNVPSALAYQVGELMPAYPGKLMLAVNHHESRTKNIALWLDYERTEHLFSAFKEQGLALTTIIPRILLTALSKQDSTKKDVEARYREQDEQGMLQITLDHHSLSQWHTISNKDMEQAVFYQEWERLAQASSDLVAIKSADFWRNIDVKNLDQLAYSFFPEAALHNLKKHSRLKKGRLAAIAGVIVVLLLSLPFISNMVRYYKYEKKYNEHMQQTAEIRNKRRSVTDFEDNWGAFLSYPKADISAVIRKLNGIIPKDSWIQGFEIKDGYIEIDGYSPNPTNVLELISRQAEFEQAAFNQRTRVQRGKNNEHFGITFRLNTVDVAAYQEQHFPVN